MRTILASSVLFLVACGGGSSDSTSADAQLPRDTTSADPAKANAPDAPPVPKIEVGSAPVTGFFVSAKAAAGGDGTADHPVGTLKEAIIKSQGTGTPVIACAEDYAENVDLVDGVIILGYFDCANGWKRGTTNATIHAPQSPALTAKNVTKGARMEGFDVYAPNAATSIAFSIKDSTAIAFANGSLHAGDATPGIDGDAAAEAVELSNATLGGPGFVHSTTYLAVYGNDSKRRGSAGGTSHCATGASGWPGGAGGDSLIYNRGQFAVPGAGYPWEGDEHTSTGGLQYGGSIDAKPASSGARGSDGANGEWSFDANGFVAGSAARGNDGAPGGGGGGGASEGLILNTYGYVIGANGSGGGAGGCPGLAGGAGTGGGASIAAFIVSSRNVSFESARLESNKGGAGGRGDIGSFGLAGGSPGPSVGAPSGTGAAGGAGGDSGVSGNGAPGPSIVIAWSGTRPTVGKDVTLTPGAAGTTPDRTKGSISYPGTIGVSKTEHQF